LLIGFPFNLNAIKFAIERFNEPILTTVSTIDWDKILVNVLLHVAVFISRH
jgi:hypothetical protein